MGAHRLAQERLALFGEVDSVAAAIIGIGSAIDEFTPFECIQEADKVRLLNAQGFADISLAHARIGMDQNQSAELRRTNVERTHDLVKALGGRITRHAQRESEAVSKGAGIEGNGSRRSRVFGVTTCSFFLFHSL